MNVDANINVMGEGVGSELSTTVLVRSTFYFFVSKMQPGKARNAMLGLN